MLNVVLKNYEIGNDDIYEIDLIDVSERCESIPTDIDKDYPLKFNLPTKFFKKMINDISQCSNFVTIEKNGLDPLQIKYTASRRMTSCSTYKDPEKINLVSTVGATDIFSVSIKIDYLTAFAKSGIGETISISAHKYLPIVFRSTLDNDVCSVMMMTEILKF
jgi:energy-converting hydrogenase Eha subunit C